MEAGMAIQGSVAELRSDDDGGVLWVSGRGESDRLGSSP